MEFNRKELIKAIIAEAHDEALAGYERVRKNVRGFYYERLLYTLRTVMKDDGTANSVKSTIGMAWRELVESGRVTYSAMNIYSKRSEDYHVAVTQDSPYPTVVVLVEKADFFEPLHDLADIYSIAFVATGGNNSRCAAMEYIEQLRRKGIDLNQPFTVYSFCDFDPQGWDIPVGFIHHLSIKISAPIQLVRLGVLKEQITESILQYQASPYASVKAKADRAKKAEQTLYDNFIAETGGIFMPGTDIPARVELDMYTGEQIRERIIEGLAKHLDGFQYQVDKLKEIIGEEFDRAHDAALDELMEEWDDEREPNPRLAEIEEEIDTLEIEKAERTAKEDGELRELRKRVQELYEEADERTGKLDRRCEREIKRLMAKYENLQDNVHREINSKLSPLHAQIEELTDIKRDKTADLRSQERALEEERNNIDEGEGTLWAYQKDNYEWFINQWYANSDDVISSIEQNGDWRSWLNEVRIEEIDLEEAGRGREVIDWEPTYYDRENIWEWMKDTLKSSIN